jgi:hypothetical protein
MPKAKRGGESQIERYDILIRLYQAKIIDMQKAKQRYLIVGHALKQYKLDGTVTNLTAEYARQNCAEV